MNFLALMYVALGGALGSMARYVMMSLVGRIGASEFPFGTLVVNIIGSFLMGVLIAAIASTLPARSRDLHLLLAVGVLGGFTTFSTFSLDVFTLVERGFPGQAALYTAGSVLLSVLALIAGMWVTKVSVG